MLWLALYCPTLPLDCILRRWPEGLDPALAVTDLAGTKRLIAVVTQKAQACGVFAGQSVATALSLVPDLVVVARKIDDERAALAEAALAALRFTPIVSLRASGVVMEISASLKLFGGRRAFKASLASAMRVQGLQVCAAEAPTPHGAWLLAQERARRRTQTRKRDPAANAKPSRPIRPSREPFDAALAALPIGHLESARPFVKRFEGIGLFTFADLRRLPVGGLARRFGTDLTDELARAAGDLPDPQTVFEAPSRFDARIELMARVETAEALVFATQRLLAQMTGWLTARRAAVRGFTLKLHHDRWTRDAIEPTAVPIALASPSSDLSRLTTLVRERLSHLELKAPVLELALEAPVIVEEQEAYGMLFPECERGTETLARLLEKLTARLGPDAMSRLERAADHRPEHAWREWRGDLLGGEAAGGSRRRARMASAKSVACASTGGIDVAMRAGPPAARPRGSSAVASACACGPRPAWLLSEPQPLEMRAERPLFEALPIALVAGPERVETGWWDDAPATRDYYIGENTAGRLVWIYRERLIIEDRALWYLQGLFG